MLISIGGWTGSTNFPTVAATASSRQTFVASAIRRFLQGQFAAGDGLYQAGTAAAGTYEAGIEDYKVLKGLEGTFTNYTHPETQAFYIYNPATQVWWSYDNPSSMATKMIYILSKGLGGAMFWELSGDDAVGSLISAMKAGLALSSRPIREPVRKTGLTPALAPR